MEGSGGQCAGDEWRLNEEVLSVAPDADTIISELVTEALTVKDLKSGMRRRILFVGDDGSVYETQAMTAAALAVQLVRALSIYIKGAK